MDYWIAHPGPIGFFMLLAFALLPRVSILFTIAVSLSVKASIVWVLFPSVLVAYHAYNVYWESNPTLVIIACIWIPIKFLIFLFKIALNLLSAAG
jgi:hypothetical protein